MSSSSGSDVEALETTREESRIVLDHHIDFQKNLDDKALRTVRLSLVLIALVVSVAQLLEPAQINNIEVGTILAVGFAVFSLALSIFIGLAVYLVTEIPFGVGESHRSEVTDQTYSAEEWFEVLIDEYDSWIETSREIKESNALWLSRAQFAMAIGVAYLFITTFVLVTPISAGDAFFGPSVIMAIALIVYLLVTRVREQNG